MDIYVFSNSKKLKLFKDMKKNDRLIVFTYKNSKKELPKIPCGSILYFDIDSLKPNSIEKTIIPMMKRKDLRYGIYDSKNLLSDIAGFFHAGGADYAGKNLIKKGVSLKRLANVAAFKPIETKKTTVKAKDSLPGYKIAPNGWKGIKPGSEYTFILMYIELDNQKELRDFYSGNSIIAFRKSFHDLIEIKTEHIGGKVWMWSDFGGLILIPFNGKSCNAIEFSFRLLLDKILYIVEDINVAQYLSFRIALHLGNTIYKSRGNTGTIISDSINSIHHLGQKYLKQGQFGLTADLERFIPQWLKSYFIPYGEYEGRKIIRMKTLE